MTHIESLMNTRFRSVASLAIVSVSLGVESTFAQSTERVSVDSSGAQGNFNSTFASISVDGRFVAFESRSTNFVVGDTNSATDIFVRDRLGGTTERVSVATSGTEGNSNSYRASISFDGRFVVFHSYSTGLVAGDTNATSDVFVRDRVGATTDRASLGMGGAQANSESLSAAISADGRFVAFQSQATNLVAGDTNATWDVFVRDRLNATTERVSVSSTESQVNGASDMPTISADGRYVAFRSLSKQLVFGDTNNRMDIFVRDRTKGRTARVSVSNAGAQANGKSEYSAISADGRFVTFESDAVNLITGDVNANIDVFVRDLVHSTTEIVSVATSGAQGNEISSLPSISAGGRFVTFVSFASNLVGGDTNGSFDTFVHDRQNGKTERVSVDSAGMQGNSSSLTAGSVSGDGLCIAFESAATNLIGGDTNNVSDIFVRDRGVPTPVSYCSPGTTSNGCSASIAASTNPSVSLAHACSLTVSNVDGQVTGILFYGIDNANFAPVPWALGSTSWLCVKSPIQRTPVQGSGGTLNACDGSYALDWNAYQAANPLALGNPWSAGAAVHAQAWFRDPLASKSTNLSHAVEMTNVP